ncbi:MAG: tRNA/rRNA methyltransferase [Planctomycetota bacterium]|jgi:tRNA/rRNA methyltransferase
MKRIVLCRPEGPRNVGTVLRVAQNFGPTEIFIVGSPKATLLIHPDFVQMSHGAEDARAAIRQVDTLQEALTDCTDSIGFTARVRGDRVRQSWRSLREAALVPANDIERKLALVFGSEEAGMTREETDLCQQLCHLRTRPEHTSLNLGMAVGVVLSSLFEQEGVLPPEPGGRRLNGDGREFLKARMKQVFAGEIALNSEAAKLIEAMIERVISRAELENRDAKAWHLILKVLGSDMRPDSLGLRPHVKGGRRRMLMEDDEYDGSSPLDVESE